MEQYRFLYYQYGKNSDKECNSQVLTINQLSQWGIRKRGICLTKSFQKLLIGILGLGFLLIYCLNSFMWAEEQPPQETTVIGSANFSNDPDRMYKEAMEDAFFKAYAKVNQSAIPDNNNFTKEPLNIQRELGIVQYHVLRYWRENDHFFIELKVVFGNSTSEAPRPSDLSRLAKLNWMYQSVDLINYIGKTKTALAVNTTQTIEVIDPDKGQRLQQFKIGLNPHDFYGDQYVVQEGENLKVARLTKYNLFKLVYTWRQRLPELSKYVVTRDLFFTIERNGLMRALNWEDGSTKWSINVNSQSDLEEISYQRFLITFPSPEVWMMSANGEKLWVTKFESGLLAKPVVGGTEIYCLLKNGDLKIVDRDTGRIISTWNVKNQYSNRNINLQLNDKELFILYNDMGSRGHLQAYHRFTGELLWETNWKEAVSGSILKVADAIVIGVGNTFEARDPFFGMKIWEEPIYGRITKMYNIDNQLFLVAGNRLYCYDFN